MDLLPEFYIEIDTSQLAWVVSSCELPMPPWGNCVVEELDPETVVLRFCGAWDRLDFDAIAALLADDIDYHNIPLEPLCGKDKVEAYLRGAGPIDYCRWEIVSIAAQGTKVLTERIDRFVVRGARIDLSVMGTFEIENGKIRRWRDYFDLASYRAQWPAKGSD